MKAYTIVVATFLVAGCYMDPVEEDALDADFEELTSSTDGGTTTTTTTPPPTTSTTRLWVGPVTSSCSAGWRYGPILRSVLCTCTQRRGTTGPSCHTPVTSEHYCDSTVSGFDGISPIPVCGAAEIDFCEDFCANAAGCARPGCY